jgi:hypothetical protein
MSAAFTLIAAGPPRLADAGAAASLSVSAEGAAAGIGGGDVAMPIGVVQNFNLSHNRQFSRFFEIGSERSYFMSGRTFGQIGLSRIMYHGPSLLRMLYAYYADSAPATFNAVFATSISPFANRHDVVVPPGYDNVFLNLASDLFHQPIGLMLAFKDSNESTMSQAYLEGCYVPTHTLASDAQGTIIQESAQIQFERLVPIRVDAVALIAGVEADIDFSGSAAFSGRPQQKPHPGFPGWGFLEEHARMGEERSPGRLQLDGTKATRARSTSNAAYPRLLG